MKSSVLHPLFFAGLFVRLLLIIGISRDPAATWYVPFIKLGIHSLVVDPWSAWLNAGRSPAAFPYGCAMWLAFLPLSLLAKTLALPTQYAYSATIAVADFALLLVLNRLIRGREQLLLSIYWMSPIVIIATYVLGSNGLVPTLLLMLSILFARRVHLKLTGGFLAAAISANPSILIALPFFVIYLYHKRVLRQYVQDFLRGFVVCALLLGLPFCISSGPVKMLLTNSDTETLYHLTLDLGDGFSIYWELLTYTLLLYATWRIKRLNFDIFQVTMGMAFLLTGLMTPAASNWLLYCVPFLCLYQTISGSIAVVLVTILSALYSLGALLVMPVRLETGVSIDLPNALHISEPLGRHFSSLLHTMMVSVGVIIAVRIWREAVGNNDYFRLSRKPFVIGVAGDSGAGKDTYAEALTGLFGHHSVVNLSGDDYHLWDRQKPMWQVMSHLNPMANDLEGFSSALVSLIDGKAIYLRHYDHQTGRMSKPTRAKSNDFIIASGLHALYLPITRECCNLKIYLGIDERLRRHFKIQRDVHQRGHSVERVLASLEKREPDSRRFIRPQAIHADLILCLQPIHPRMLDAVRSEYPLRLKLMATTRQGFNELALNRVLVGVCGLHVDVLVSDDSREVQMTIEGETSAADMALAAEMLCPRMLEFLDMPPRWQDGMTGIMQLITLSHISQALTKRFI